MLSFDRFLDTAHAIILYRGGACPILARALLLNLITVYQCLINDLYAMPCLLGNLT